MNKVVLSLGGNKGDVLKTLKKAKVAIEDKIGRIILSSSLYKTAAWGVTNQPDFINQVIVVETKYLPNQLLDFCMQIELLLGRVRTNDNRWKERVVDIDILYFNDEIIHSSTLQIPHIQIENRKFILVPLVEVLPNFLHPGLKLTNSELLTNCNDSLSVELLGKLY